MTKRQNTQNIETYDIIIMTAFLTKTLEILFGQSGVEFTLNMGNKLFLSLYLLKQNLV